MVASCGRCDAGNRIWNVRSDTGVQGKGRTQDFDYSEILITLRQVSNRGIAMNTLAEGYVRTVRLVLPCNTTVVSLHFYHLSKVLPEGLQRSFGIYSERCWFLGSIRDLFRIYSGSIGFPDLAKFRVQPSQFDPWAGSSKYAETCHQVISLCRSFRDWVPRKLDIAF